MRHGARARAAIISQLALFVVGCTTANNSVPASTSTASGATPLTAEQRAAGWRSLFDGTSTSAWRGYKTQTFPAAWTIVDGVLTKSAIGRRHHHERPVRQLRARARLEDREGGNAGVFYRGTEEYDHIYWSAPEYQLLDDANASGRTRAGSRRAGADYALYPSPDGRGQAGRRVELDAHRRAVAATSSTG